MTTSSPEAAARPMSTLAGGLAGVALAGLGEFFVAARHAALPGALCYFAGIFLFARTGRRVPTASEDLPAEELPAPDSRVRRAFAGWGAGAGVLLAATAARQIDRGLAANTTSRTGLLLWLLALCVVLAAGLFRGGGTGWPARWGLRGWPASPRRRWILAAAFVAILVVAAAARLVSLKTLPYGIEADEGDRGALAIQVVRGNPTPGIFEDGWYQISMVYFWLLAQVMKIVGIGFAQARVLSAVTGILTVVAVTFLAVRNFGLRVGLLSGALLSLLGVALQFSRLTTEATPTAMLWAASMALFLEAARRGKDWAWIGAGLAGGFSVYFYPTGRLWAALAALYGVYLFARGPRGSRGRIFRGTALAAAAAFVVASPFLALGFRRPLVLWQRARDTSVFAGDNATRLEYYKREWSGPRLLFEQTARSLGIFNRYGDQGGIWPTRLPIMGHGLTVLTFLGLGWSCLRPRDPRFAGLALWFWVGFAGVIVTVETPNLHRMATAVPVLALFPALVLDNLARRVEAFFPSRPSNRPATVRLAATVAAGLAAAVLIAREARFYFVDYARMDGWPSTRVETDAVRLQDPDALVTSVGRFAHMVNSGWVRLMAPQTARGAIPSPGSDLPLAMPARGSLVFLIYRQQSDYLPYLQELYPGGDVRNWTHSTEGLVVRTYRLTREQWASTQGALATPASGPSQRVATLGQRPASSAQDTGPVRWTAGLRAPRYGNYAFLAGPGAARLTIDRKDVLEVPAGAPAMSATVALARGIHAVAYEAAPRGAGSEPLLRWAPARSSEGSAPAPPDWRAVLPEELTPGLTAQQGLLGVVRIVGRPEQRRIDGTLATCCLSDQIDAGGSPYEAVWTGTLTAPETGDYAMGLIVGGVAELKLDGKSVLRAEGDGSREWNGTVALAAGPHSVELVLRVPSGPGVIEWTWAPPGKIPSIVPPSALSPPPEAGIGPAVEASVLGGSDAQPLRPPLTTIR